jgi:DNA invertase Pin-like site-specific DNA recombinase
MERMRAGAYLRISRVRRQDGTEETLGVERQQPPCMELAARKGWEIDPRPYTQGGTVYTDNDLSAFSGRTRPAYQQMLTDARDGKLAAIVAWDADRLTRRPVENEELIELVERHGIALATVTGDYDLQSSSGRLHFRIAGALARRESEHRSERVKLKHAELRENGKWSGGRRPFGYQLAPVMVNAKVKYRLELDETEAELIRQAAKRILAGGSLYSITRDWTVSGVRRPEGRLWDTPKLRVMLTSPRIAGRRQNGQDLVDADWPAIISMTELESLRAILATKPAGRGPKEPRVYLGTGIYLCDLCGTPLRGQPHGRNSVAGYACRADRGGCGKLHRTARPIDDFVRDEILDALASPEFRAKLERFYGAGTDDKATALVAKREGALRRLRQLRDLAGDPDVEFDVDDFAAAKRRLAAMIEETTAQLGELTTSNLLADLPDTPELLHDLWEHCGLDRRRALVRLAADEIILKAPGRGQRFQPTDEHVVIIPKV